MEDRKRFWILLLPADLCRREFFSMMGNSTVISSDRKALRATMRSSERGTKAVRPGFYNVECVKHTFILGRES